MIGESRAARLAAGLALRLGTRAVNAAARASAAWDRGRARPRPALRPWAPGISVVIPDRGTPDLLAACLASLEPALTEVREPVQVIVSLNGASAADLDGARRRHAAIEWAHSEAPLGYGGAVVRALPMVRYDWVYLLNNDMTLAPDALAQLLPWRAREVFALASQIFFADPERRREETGWTDWRPSPAGAEIFDLEPTHPRLVRGHLYAGGGASLFRTALLRRFVRATADYHPFYWEDADWGVQAGREGYACRFCPTSRVWHRHRATVSRFFAPAEIDRIFRRNGLLFELRHGLAYARLGARALDALDAESAVELTRPAVVARAWRQRWATRRALGRWYRPAQATASWFPRPAVPGRPTIVLVTPFAVARPSHGGARRILELTRALADRANWVLVSDEGGAYDDRAAEVWLDHCVAVYTSAPRPPIAREARERARLAGHAHPGLRAALAQAIAAHRPSVVHVEHGELVGLAEGRRAGERWWLALHDVPATGDARADRALLRRLARFDRVVVVSPEDRRLLPASLPAIVVPNGAPHPAASWAPSPSAPELLFVGSLRYRPNRDGLLRFVRSALPEVQRAVPGCRLTVLAGPDTAGVADGEMDAGLARPGVEVVREYADPRGFLARSALAINPQRDIRGSAVKVIEALAAGRMMVSTEDGARGYRDAEGHGLVPVATVDAMAAPIVRWLGDHEARRAKERAARAYASGRSWRASAQTWWSALAGDVPCGEGDRDPR